MQLVNQQNFQVCTSRASSAASISTGVLRDSPRNGQDEVGKISVKSLRRFRSDFDQASNCKLQGQSLGTVQTLYRRCRTFALQLAQFTETKLVSKFAQGIKNLYLLCKGRAVGKGGKGQLVAIRNCRSVFLFAGMFAFVVASSESRSQTSSKIRGT